MHTRLIRVAHEFGVDKLEEGLDDRASYNIAPSREVAVVTEEGGVRRLTRAQWGITPGWKSGALLFNARAEGVAEKPSFKEAFADSRCVIVADGFYEWRREGKARTPYYFRLASGALMGFAGILEVKKESARRECAIITTGANTIVGKVHTRMPVIFQSDNIGPWLHPDSDKKDLLGLLVPLEPDLMEGYEVSAIVGSVSHDSPENIKPVAA